MGAAPGFMRIKAAAMRTRKLCSVLIALIWGMLCRHWCTSLRHNGQVPPLIGLAVELSQIPLPLPTALAPHGIAQIVFRQQTFTNCTGSHPHHAPHRPARIVQDCFGSVSLLDNDGCDCRHYTHSRCTQTAKLIARLAVDGKPDESARITLMLFRLPLIARHFAGSEA